MSSSEQDLHGLGSLPIVPGEQLGGFQIGANVREYSALLQAEWNHRFFKMPADPFRQREREWGTYWPTWGLAIRIWPVQVHVDIRDGSIYRVEAEPGYASSYAGIAIGMRFIEAKELEPKIGLNDIEQALTIDGVDGLYFGLTESDPMGADEYLLQLKIADIGVYDPARGTTLQF